MALFDFLRRKQLQEIDNLRRELERYKPIADIDQEAAKKKRELEDSISIKELEFQTMFQAKSQELKILEDKINSLDADYKIAFETYTRLRKEVGLFESKLDIIEYGIYEPLYDFAKSDEYRTEQNRIIEEQKNMIRLDQAAICPTKWTVENSEAKGRVVVNRYKKLMLRAFNGECDAMIAKVKWNNIDQMKLRMTTLFNAINKLGEGFNVYLSSDYHNLKKQELILEYEYCSKKQKEKEEMRAIQEELREEEKARREFEQAQREAEKDELNYQKALDKARIEIEAATGEKHEILKFKIEKLEEELKEAQEKKERAISMAQQTKRGHVYIISNIGSFGENVYKIGMTRRLEPTDRVHELGSASVPFHFDIHAMIYSDEAPNLENELHRAFSNRKVNMLNYRKEFFNVTLEEIEQKIKELDFDAEFTRLPEAMEYRETLAIIEKMNSHTDFKSIDEMIANEFPKSLNPS